MIGDVLADYLTEHGNKVAAGTTQAMCVKALVPYWGELPVVAVTKETCAAYQRFRDESLTTRRGRGIRPGTVRRELGTLEAAINHDVRMGRMTRTVAVFCPAQEKAKDRWLTRDEAASLLRAARGVGQASGYLPLFILMGLYTAARKEAILTLRWAQVDLKRWQIDFNPPGREQTSKGRSVIPVPVPLRHFLYHARRRGTAFGTVIQRDGKPLGDIKRGFSSACRAAGLTDVTPHTLRHTAISWMVQNGVPFPKVARFAGHNSSRVTEQVYAHHAPDYLDDAAKGLQRKKTR